mgnify:CR=1 FL=1
MESRADIYLQLSRLEETGFPAQQTFELLQKTNPKLLKQLHQLQRYLKAGNSIADSGFKAGIFSEFDKTLLQAGEVSGNLAVIYKQLAWNYAQKVKRSKKIKSQCYLPIAILIIALFVQPIPALISNEITGLDYLVLSVGRLFKLALLIYISINLPFWLTLGRLKFLGLANVVYSFQFKLPLVSSWLIARQRQQFLGNLGLMLAAGVPILEALPKAQNTIANPILRKQFDSVILATANGATLTDALANVPEMDSQAIAILLVGEKSGKLAKTILHHVKIEKETTDLQEDLLAEWIPRIFYFAVVAWVASSIIAGNSINKIPF